MLDLITKSKTRQRIILLFIYNPKQSYYLNEIARLIGTSSGTAQRELRRLTEVGLLNREKQGNSVYFKINTSNPLFVDFKNIVDKTIGLENILKRTLEKEKNIDFAFLFGSYAKDDFGLKSDIDLYIIGDIEEKQLHRLVKTAEEKIYREINYHLSSKEEFQRKIKETFFHKEILKNFILIIGNKDEFRELIK